MDELAVEDRAASGDLNEVIDRFTPFGQTATAIVQSSPVRRRGVPLCA
jgi:hypothetical protein